jgi:hypothetical protein
MAIAFYMDVHISVGDAFVIWKMIAKIGELDDVVNKVSYLPF